MLRHECVTLDRMWHVMICQILASMLNKTPGGKSAACCDIMPRMSYIGEASQLDLPGVIKKFVDRA